MNYKYTMPLFDIDDQDEALNYLVERFIKEGTDLFTKLDSVKLMKQTPGEDPELMDFDDIPKELLKDIMMHIYSSAFGRNIVLMANYFKVQDKFFDDFESDLLKYLDLCRSKVKEANIIYITPNQIILENIIDKAMKSSSFQPISYWNPNSEWEWHLMQESRKKRKDDYMNPLNHLRSVVLNIKGSIPSDFIRYLDNYGVEFIDIGKDDTDKIINSVSIQLLPFPSYNNLVTVMQGIYKYF